MNVDLNKQALDLIRHYKSLLTYSDINIEDNHVKLYRTARKLSIDFCKNKIEFLNKTIGHLSDAGAENTIAYFGTMQKNYLQILQILQENNE